MERPSIFVSYAHEDQTRISRLVFALSLYTEVFWDKRLMAGEFHHMLLAEIDNRESFLLMISPNSLNSEWCKKELDYAAARRKPIALAKIGDCNTSNEFYVDLTSKYTYGDFTEDFEAGFRRLTQLIFNYPLSSWERVVDQSDDLIIKYLSAGYLPALIVKEVLEYCVVEWIWKYCQEYATERKSHISFGSLSRPRTISGIYRYAATMKSYASSDPIRDFAASAYWARLMEFVSNCHKSILTIRDDESVLAGEIAGKMISDVQEFFVYEYGLNRDFARLGELQSVFRFNIAEKIRELILTHSRRSRYLY